MTSSSVIQNLEAVELSDFKSEAERIRAKDAALALAARLETPWETVWRLVFTMPGVMTALKICHDLRLFEKWGEKGLDKAMKIEQLSNMAGAQSLLLERLLRHMHVANVVEQVDSETFKLTAFTKQLADGMLPTAIRHYYEVNLPAFNSLPPVLKELGYKCPTDNADTALGRVTGKKTIYEYLLGIDGATENFSSLMKMLAGSSLPWPEIFPTQSLIDGRKEDRVIVVDVAGNQGHDIEKLRTVHPNLPAGSLVLQDLPEIIELPLVKALDPVIKPMAHDFFESQPVKGAGAYYFHHILHNWNDTETVKILKRIADAMEPGYSRLLIHEASNPDLQPSAHTTGLDIAMMSVLSALERTDRMWEEVIAKADLKIVKIWRHPNDVEEIIEAVLA